MFGFLKKLVGTKHDKDIKDIKPLVEEINSIFANLHLLSDEQLREKTNEFRTLIEGKITQFAEERAEIQNKLVEGDITHEERQDLYARLHELESEEYAIVRETLDDILPEAFAVVKEAARRLTERKHQYVVTDQTLTWAMVPYDVQMMGGIILHQGKISEMATGEGKTLVAVAPLYLNSLAGFGCHLVTVNDYLAKRDSEWMKPVFEFLGVSVGCIQSAMDPAERKVHYGCDITYGTNNEFGFDYLRDNMVTDAEDMVHRKYFYAIVDEVDSVLIDEARTPLIISGPVGQAADQKFEELNPRVRKLVENQQRLVNNYVNDAERLLLSGKKEDKEQAGILLLRAYRGFPKHKKLLKLMQEPEFAKLKNETELEYLRDQGSRMHEIDDELYYTIDEKKHGIDIHEKGRNLLATSQEDANLFLIPDITTEMSAIEGNESYSSDEKAARKDEIMRVFADRSERIHTATQLLRAYSLYARDDEYVVQDNKVKIVDEFTGRILEGRRYSDGLHQAIEAKEGVEVERDTQTLATITLQNYFRLYKKLAGMTGTAETEAGEFYQIYKLDVVVIPTNRPIVRQDRDDLIYRTKREKYNAVVQEIQEQLRAGRAILVGTTSVEVSEVLSKMLTRSGIKHNVLNAKHHQREAEIVQEAGRKGAVTIATNMAGRGTDIKLDPDVKENGGLCIIGTERHEARRIDRQLRGRAGRQGDPGTSQFFVSLEDDLMRLFGGERITSMMERFKMNLQEGEPISAGMVTKSVERAQKKVEENNFGIRKRLIDYDDVMNKQREVVYDRRRHALGGERMKSEIFAAVSEAAQNFYEQYQPNNEYDEFMNAVRTLLLCEPAITKQEFKSISVDEVVTRVEAASEEYYQRKESQLGSEFMLQLEKFSVLQSIDDKWREHLRIMDDLKEGIYLRSYGQKDPLLEYKREAYELFTELIVEINKETASIAFKYYPVVQERAQPQQAVVSSARRKPAQELDENGIPVLQSTSTRALNFSHPTVSGTQSAQHAVDTNIPEPPQQKQKGVTVYRDEPKINRNDLCPCGSGKKYKKCHGANS